MSAKYKSKKVWTDEDMFYFATFYATNYKRPNGTFEKLLKDWISNKTKINVPKINKTYANRLGELVKEYRQIANLSLRDFGKLVDCSIGSISRIERGMECDFETAMKLFSHIIQDAKGLHSDLFEELLRVDRLLKFIKPL